MAHVAVCAALALLGTTSCRRKEPSSLIPPAEPAKEDAALFRAGYPGLVDVVIDAQPTKVLRPISPAVYGSNMVADAQRQRWGLLRSGGNRLTAYNWETNASNAGSDWHFQNDSFLSNSDVPAAAVRGAIEVASGISGAALLTVSTADFVAADKLGGGDVRQSGANYLQTRFVRNVARKPTPFAAAPDPNDGVVYQDEFVAFMRAAFPAARAVFSMDNEPDLWSHTHAEIFPKPVTYEDLWARNERFAAATKDAWPAAEVAGFVSYGYNGMVSLQDAPDAKGREFVDWYLDQARAAEQRTGRRLIDYLDVHWYPEATGGGERILGESSSAAVVEAREQAPRSLWHPGYRETSWISAKIGGPICLLPWLQRKIDAHYPGTRIGISEWNYGGGGHISGAIAVADVLGIFGRHGVGLAAYWPMSADESFALAAFRVYRNFDDRGAAFGDLAVETTSSDPLTATAYASVDSTDRGRVVVVLINKATTAKKIGVGVSHTVLYKRARSYLLTADRPEIRKGPELSLAATNAFSLDMPSQSIAVVVPEL
jgi:Glycoside hydrolase family 44